MQQFFRIILVGLLILLLFWIIPSKIWGNNDTPTQDPPQQDEEYIPGDSTYKTYTMTLLVNLSDSGLTESTKIRFNFLDPQTNTVTFFDANTSISGSSIWLSEHLLTEGDYEVYLEITNPEDYILIDYTITINNETQSLTYLEDNTIRFSFNTANYSDTETIMFNVSNLQYEEQTI